MNILLMEHNFGVSIEYIEEDERSRHCRFIAFAATNAELSFNNCYEWRCFD